MITSLPTFLQNLKKLSTNSQKTSSKRSSKRRRDFLEEAKWEIRQFDTSFASKRKQKKRKPDFKPVKENMKKFAKKSVKKRKKRKKEEIVECAERREFSWKDGSSPLLNFMPIS